MTFSIVARSEDGESWGVAVASRFLAVGRAVPAAVAGIGAIATQADANMTYKAAALAHMDEGATAEVALATLLEGDELRDHRQVGIVDLDGNAAGHTGSQCHEWAGNITDTDVAIQGNILSGPEVLEAMRTSWDATRGEPDLARRLLMALVAGDQAGGDRRGRQSAALLVVREGAGYSGGDDVAVDLRVDDHPQPCDELTRLLDLNDLYLTASRDDEKVSVTPELRDELERRSRQLGHPDFDAWVGTENYEMRVGADFVDEKVLQILRDATGDLT
jgi:uncharacterized Ntn-hydrolase superfamily protein